MLNAQLTRYISLFHQISFRFHCYVPINSPHYVWCVHVILVRKTAGHNSSGLQLQSIYPSVTDVCVTSLTQFPFQSRMK